MQRVARSVPLFALAILAFGCAAPPEPPGSKGSPDLPLVIVQVKGMT